jgi:hypothetical protein
MRVQQTDLIQTGLAGTAAASEPRKAERSFGATLAEKSGKADKAPKGEATQKVDGHGYVEVVSGPRNGMFINKSGNDRDGQAFVRKRGADFDLHIYGTGANREIVKVPHKGPVEKEATTPVDGRPYAEITAGSRNGMFVNTTSNERSGEAFVLVRRDDRDLHIYGSGKDRRVVVSWHKDRDDAKPEAAKDPQKDPKLESGGVAAPTT